MANPNPNPLGRLKNLRPQWKPGEPGNPKGYSKARRTTDALVKLIESAGNDDAIAQVWLDRIKAGDFRFYKEYLDRTEGKVPEKVEVRDMSKLSDEELRSIAEGASGGDT